MLWIVCLVISMVALVLCFTLAAALSKFGSKRHKIISPREILFSGVFISSAMIFIPIYAASFYGENGSVLKTVLLSIHNTMRLFVIDSDYEIIYKGASHLPGMLRSAYSSVAAIIYMIAPLLTFTFVLSFIKNVSAYAKYITHFYCDTCVFSELNEKSLTLAADIAQNKKRNIIVFTDTFIEDDSVNGELLERARELNAICFKKDVISINLRLHSKKSMLSFFVIGADGSKNVEQSLKIIAAYNQRQDTKLYLFSSSIESELLINAVPKGMIKVRRVNEAQSLIARTLYEKGHEVFERAIETDNKERLISAVIIGMGPHGTEMIKALTWFCQMDGYSVQIDAFDSDEKAESKFSAACPELMSARYNGVCRDGEARYRINIHPGIEVGTDEFAGQIKEMIHTTYVLVALGSDEGNIRAAVNLRMLFERIKIKPQIQAIVYSTNKREALSGIKNYSGQAYDIDFIGDMKTSYSEDVVINSELEKEALARHLKWGKEEEFWAYEYNYRSSVASAIHMKAREACGVPGAGKKEEDLTDSEKEITELIEHRRWNAYMRSEGYVYSGSMEKSSRNDLAKTHNSLVHFYDLSEDERRKNRKVGSK